MKTELLMGIKFSVYYYEKVLGRCGKTQIFGNNTNRSKLFAGRD
jgi:hypothetical protein